MNLKPEQVEISEFLDFENSSTVVRASVKFTVAIDIPHEDGDVIDKAVLLHRAYDQAVSTLIDSPEKYLCRAGQPAQHIPLRGKS